MPNYRRWYVPGGTCFFTVVTHNRQPLLADPDALSYLRIAIRDVRSRHPFEIPAIVVLPDHLHCVWTLPPGDDRFSLRWNQIKGRFTEQWTCQQARPEPRNSSRRRRGEQAIWQRRFWEHRVREESELSEIFDYIHFNPVKHGWVRRVQDWCPSSFHRFVRDGLYEENWGSVEPTIRRTIWLMGE